MIRLGTFSAVVMGSVQWHQDYWFKSSLSDSWNPQSVKKSICQEKSSRQWGSLSVTKNHQFQSVGYPLSVTKKCLCVTKNHHFLKGSVNVKKWYRLWFWIRKSENMSKIAKWNPMLLGREIISHPKVSLNLINNILYELRAGGAKQDVVKTPGFTRTN